MTETLLTADRVLPGPAGQVVADGGVLVRDGTIAEVGPADELARQAADAETRRFPGGTILPGLIDSHVHLALDAGADQSEIIHRFGQRGDSLLLADMHTRAAAAQRAGITTIRDVGDARGLVARLRSADDQQRLPRLLTAGAPVTTPGGDAAFFGGAVDEGDLRDAVRARAEQGADLISVVASGGHLSTADGPPAHESQFNLPQLTEIVSEARAAGLPVVAHAHGAQAIEDAVTAGVSTVEHATWVVGPQQVEFDEKVAAQMAERGIGVCVTASLNWRRIVSQMGADRAWENFYGKLRWLHDAGVRLLAGSRAGTANAQTNDLVSALELYAWAGVPTATVLESATTGAAAALGLSETTGELAAGRAADLLVVGGNPADDLGALRRVQAVLQHGLWR